MNNPLNQLPADAELIKRIDHACDSLAKETGNMIILVALKENAKTQVCVSGIPETGFLSDLAADIPKFLEMTAQLIRLNNLIEKANPQ